MTNHKSIRHFYKYVIALIGIVVLTINFSFTSKKVSEKYRMDSYEYFYFLNRLGSSYEDCLKNPSKINDVWGTDFRYHNKSIQYSPKQNEGLDHLVVYLGFKKGICDYVYIEKAMNDGLRYHKDGAILGASVPFSIISGLYEFNFVETINAVNPSVHRPKLKYHHYSLNHTFSPFPGLESNQSIEIIHSSYAALYSRNYDTHAYLTENGKNKSLKKNNKYIGFSLD